MYWEMVSATGEWAGALAVVVTLFYLARQMRQSNQIGTAEAERDWLSKWHEVVHGFGSDEHVVRIMQQGLHDFASLTQPEKGVFHVRLAGAVNQAEVARRMAEKGLLSRDLFETNVRVIVSITNTPGGRAWWEDAGRTFAIYEYLEGRRKDTPVPPIDDLPAWRAVEI